MYNEEHIVLKPLTLSDAIAFSGIYRQLELKANFSESPFRPDETPEEFTKRVIDACEFIFTIRLKDKPESIIGDCALHHWNMELKEISIGGSLYPGYWGKGIMRFAFNLLVKIAKDDLGIKTIIGHTKTRNLRAIRVVEKMGFEKYHIDDSDTILRKEI
ncbi:hypothetical protein DHW03_15135 [Pedobacter yonginense]|uniref:N-acetyltransferase domain-containing protein n=1 Tax=Pedobacter yonginense TaxID=651869 RepID=A0A317EJ52_9SPHI|nr:GNAT family N-acetyltransferase [Pedobacter yonginense]PWS26129.1 hypothetical protein DHW03_15135 [Pedobacter yonginense]